MENSPNYVAAIDIGTSNIVTLIGKKSEGGKIDIVASSITPSLGMVRGDVRNVEQIVASIQESLANITKNSNIKVCGAYVGLSGQHIKCSQHSGYVFVKNKDSEVTRDDVATLSESMRNTQVAAGDTIIHILPQDYILDGDSDISHPVGMIGTKLEGKFNIVIGGKQNLNHAERCLKRTDIDIAGVILSSLASADAVLLDDEKELGVVVVDIGGGTSDICIYYDKTVRYMGVIPVGGNFINKDIKSVGVLERHVEKLKVKFGSALSDEIAENRIITLASINNIPSKEIGQKNLSAIIEARLMDIIDSLKEVLEHPDFKDKLKGPIVLTGGSANITDIDKLFARELNCDVRIASPTLYVSEESHEKVNLPQYSTAVGLLLRGMTIGNPTKTITIQKSKEITSPTEREIEPKEEEKEPAESRDSENFHHIGSNLNNRSTDSEADEDEDDDEVTQEDKKRGLFGWIKSKTKKYKEMFDPDELEDEEL